MWVLAAGGRVLRHKVRVRGKNKEIIGTKFMDASKGIGLNTRFSTPSAPLGSTVQTSTTGSTARARLGTLDWKLKVAIALLILAFVAAATSRLMKSKKAKSGVTTADAKKPEDGKDKESKEK